MTHRERTNSRALSPWTRWLLWGGTLVLAVCVFSSVGNPAPFPSGAAAVLSTLAVSGWVVAVWLASAWGVGLGVLRTIKVVPTDPALALALGVGVLLVAWLAVASLPGALSQIVAWGVATPGLVVLVAFRRSLRGLAPAQPPTELWIALVPIAVLVTAACSPPGILWDTEFGGYDVLSYHLQLPREWLAAQRVWPVHHNVYSYLPSAMEAAFAHLSLLRGSRDVLAGDGAALMSAQLLHAAVTIAGAWVASRAARTLLERHGLDSRASWVAGAVVLVTPWALVTGSMAYNEMAVCLLIAGAMLAGAHQALGVTSRAVLVALLIGAATLCKPTAIFLGGPAAVMLLVAWTPKRSLPIALGIGALVGLVVLSPWLVRNWAESGNPVFPHAASVFGAGHWSVDQIARFSEAHHFGGSIVDRFVLLGWHEPGQAARGFAHAQWALFAPLVLAGLVLALVRRASHLAALQLGAGFVLGLAAWLALTHLQSRFLVPLLVPGAIVVALALSVVRRRDLRAALAAVLCLQGLWCGVLFLGQRSGGQGWPGMPNAALSGGPPLLTGELFDRADAGATPESFVNVMLEPESTVLLVGDATPLYFNRPVVYATTWDDSPMTRALGDHPGDPRAQSSALLGAGIDAVLVNLSETDRLSRSGWAAPGLTVEAVRTLVDSWGPPIAAWPGGRALFMVPRERAGP